MKAAPVGGETGGWRGASHGGTEGTGEDGTKGSKAQAAQEAGTGLGGWRTPVAAGSAQRTRLRREGAGCS